MSKGKKEGRVTERNIIIRERWLELGMWFFLHCLGIPLDSDTTAARSAVLCTGWTDINTLIHSALLAAPEILFGLNYWGRQANRKVLGNNVFRRLFAPNLLVNEFYAMSCSLGISKEDALQKCIF